MDDIAHPSRNRRTRRTSSASVRPASDGEQPSQFADEERIALGALMDRFGHVGRRVVADGKSDEFGGMRRDSRPRSCSRRHVGSVARAGQAC